MRQRLFFISLALVIFSIASGFGLRYASAIAWTEPGALPPGDNVPAPINVGAGAQIKTGDLTVGGNFSVGQGQIVGAPAGGNMGGGTLNAEQLCIQGNCRVNWPEAASAFVDEGNVGFGPTAVLGTNDNVPMSLETNGVGRVQIGAAGNVGIGTTNTAFNLMVGGVAPRIYLLPSPGSNPELDFGSPAIDTHWSIYRDMGTDQLRFWRTDNKLVLTSDGNVGVGTDNPLYKLTIAGASPREYLWPSGGGNPELDFGNAAGDSHWAIYRDTATDQLRFWRNNDRLILASDGNVGIGISPNYKLDVAGQINASTNLTPAIQGTSSGDAGGFFQSDGVGGVGVYGITTSQSSFGLYGLASGESSTAVSGTASSLVGLNKGGSFFAGNASIVTGGDNNIGVMAAGGGSGGKNYGGYFKAQGSGYGVYSTVTDAGAGAWAGYFTGGQGLYGSAAVIDGNLSVNGNTTLGDAAADTLIFNTSTLSVPNNLNIDNNTLFIRSDKDRVGVGRFPGSYTLEVGGQAYITPSFLGGVGEAAGLIVELGPGLIGLAIRGQVVDPASWAGFFMGGQGAYADKLSIGVAIDSAPYLLRVTGGDAYVSGNFVVGGGVHIVYRCNDGAANEGRLITDYGGGEAKAFCGGVGTFADTGLRVK